MLAHILHLPSRTPYLNFTFREGVMKTITTILLAMFLSLAAASCNTTRGLGQDIESLGDTIEDAADKNQKDDHDD